MTQLHQIYKCNVCGNIVEVAHVGQGELVCCGQPMELQNEKANDQGQEKHVPVIEVKKDLVKIKIGETAHPMDPDHYIEWIEIIADGISYKTFLKPGQIPKAEFCLSAKQIQVRAYCNIHGLWAK